MDKRLEEIAKHYGLKAQAMKMVEEAGEMLAELGRMMLLLDRDCIEPKNYRAQADKLVEEMTDVHIMLQQLIYLLDGEDRSAGVYTQKVNRQMKRIERESNLL